MMGSTLTTWSALPIVPQWAWWMNSSRSCQTL